jgi:hypothetical protein
MQKIHEEQILPLQVVLLIQIEAEKGSSRGEACNNNYKDAATATVVGFT